MENDSLSEVVGEPLVNRASIFLHLEDGLKKNPNGLATIVAHQPPNHLGELIGRSSANPEVPDCLAWTFTELHTAAMKFAQGLIANGVQPGMKLTTLISNGIEYQITLWMSAILKLTICSLDPGATSPPRRNELQNLLARISPDVIMVNDLAGAQAVDAAMNSNNNPKALKLKILLSSPSTPPLPSPWTTLPLLSLSLPQDPTPLLRSARIQDPDRICLILFTSGTSSGKPKGCPRRVASTTHVLETQLWGRHRLLPKSSRALASTANFRIIAPTVHFAAWRAGATAVIPYSGMEAFSAAGMLEVIERYRVTFVLFIPALLHAVVADPSFGDRDLGSVTDVSLGGDLVTKGLFEKAGKAFPSAGIVVSHGMTEGGGVFVYNFNDVPAEKVRFKKDICPLGKVAAGARLRIRDPETGKTTQRGEMGELCICCDSVIRDYLDMANAESFFEDEKGRWLRTGDLGLVDREGVFYILGRIKDVIKRAGVPITPAALENCLQDFIGTQVSVVGYPHPVLGQEPVAVAEDDNGKTETEIKSHVLDVFGKDYAIGHFITLKQLELINFPLNATGKVMKFDLIKSIEPFLKNQAAV